MSATGFAFAPMLLVGFAFGYLCGTIPFGLLLTRGAGLGDVRAIGSGNIGATNVLRTGRKDLAAATLLLDAFKGLVAVLLARAFGGEGAAVAAGLGAFLGHVFPIWLRFRGGKGIATFLGVLIGLAWPAALVFAVAWLAIAGASRYSSAAALGSVTISPFATAFFAPAPAVGAIFGMAVLAWWTHRENVRRLLSGRETRIGQKA